MELFSFNVPKAHFRCIWISIQLRRYSRNWLKLKDIEFDGQAILFILIHCFQDISDSRDIQTPDNDLIHFRTA